MNACEMKTRPSKPSNILSFFDKSVRKLIRLYEKKISNFPGKAPDFASILLPDPS